MGFGGLRANFQSHCDKVNAGAILKRRDCEMHVSQPMSHMRVLH